MHLPDYQGGGLVNLMQSIRLATGAAPNHYPAFRHAALESLTEANTIILFIIDGLGSDYVRQHGQESFLHSQLSGSMTSVFPSTTASSISTFLTGEAPLQHGLTGWFVYLKAIGAVTAVLPFVIRGSQEPLSQRGLDAAEFYRHVPVFDAMQVDSFVVSPNWILDSDFNQSHCGRATPVGYSDMEDMFIKLSQLIKHAQGKQYIYAYWPDFDKLSHIYGNNSEEVNHHYLVLDRAMENFLDLIHGTDTTMIVTADHGFIDTQADKVIHIEDHKPLQDSLIMPLSGEPRVGYCYVHHDKRQQFEDYIKIELDDCLWCYPSRQLVEKDFFGTGVPHPEILDRIGHYTLLMKDNYVVKDRVAGERPFHHIGVHGGVSEAEMNVPLIVMRG